MTMSHRELLAMRERRREQEAAEAKEREARERPIKKAEAALQASYRKLAAVYRDRLLGNTPDPDFFISPEVDGLRLRDEDRDEFNRHQCARFRDEHPDLPWDRNVIDLLQGYWDVNKADLISSDMIAVAVNRAMELGLVQKAVPAPPKPEPVRPVPVKVNLAISSEPEPGSETGWDWETGKPLTLTRKQIDRLSADDYRRFKKLDKASLAVSNVGPGAREVLR
jgi:hypothetical protein